MNKFRFLIGPPSVAAIRNRCGPSSQTDATHDQQPQRLRIAATVDGIFKKNERSNWHASMIFLAIGVIAPTIISQTHHAFAATKTPPNVPPVLAACSGSLRLFPPAQFDQWRDMYDNRVNQVINADLEQTSTISCTQLGSDPPTGELETLAEDLPPWKDPAKLASLKEADMGAVLLEHLRVYECSMRQDVSFFQNLGKSSTNGGFLGIPKYLQIHLQHRARAAEELTLAPDALERTLKIVDGMNRLRTMDTALDCLGRTSLDIRNTLGLAAETSACLPRIWDARGSLRDVPANSSSSTTP